MRISYHVMSAPAPIGLLFLASTERGLRYAEFLDRRSIKKVIATHAADNPGAEWTASLLDVKPVTEQLEAYFHGSLLQFAIPLDPVGTPFQREVWKQLAAIPFAATRTYGDIARSIGQPKASRAVGLANNQNPLVIIVPCHRVIGADGGLTGYGGGLPRKRWLLEHEARFSRARVLPGEITETLHTPVRATQQELVLALKPASRIPAAASRAGHGPARRSGVSQRSTPLKPSRTPALATRSANGRSIASRNKKAPTSRTTVPARAKTAAKVRAAAPVRSTRATRTRRG